MSQRFGSVWIAGGTLLSRVLGLVRSAILVYAIGSIGSAADAFATASRIPTTLYTLVATGALTSVIVPQIARATARKGQGELFINRLVTLTILLGGGVTVIALALTPPGITLLTPGWPAEQRHLAIVFALWLTPQIFFYSLYTVLGEVLNSQSVFGPYAWAPILNNIINIAGMLTFIWTIGPDPDGVGSLSKWSGGAIALLAGSTTFGIAAQALILFLFWRRAGLRFRWDMRFRGIGLGSVGKAAMWTFLSVIVAQVVGLVNTAVINLSPAGTAGLAASELVGLISVLPHSIIVISIVTTRFTRMSNSIASGDVREFRRDLVSISRQSILWMMFATAALAVLSFSVFRVIQPSASYHIISTIIPVHLANLLGLVPLSLLYTLNRGFFALSNTRTPFLIALVQGVLTLVSAPLVPFLAPRAITAVMYVFVSSYILVSCVITVFALQRKLRENLASPLFFVFLKTLAAAGVSALGGWGVYALFGAGAEGSFAVHSIFSALLTILLVAPVMALIYAVSLFILRVPEIGNGVKLLKRIAAKLTRKGTPTPRLREGADN